MLSLYNITSRSSLFLLHEDLSNFTLRAFNTTFFLLIAVLIFLKETTFHSLRLYATLLIFFLELLNNLCPQYYSMHLPPLTYTLDPSHLKVKARY